MSCLLFKILRFLFKYVHAMLQTIMGSRNWTPVLEEQKALLTLKSSLLTQDGSFYLEFY